MYKFGAVFEGVKSMAQWRWGEAHCPALVIKKKINSKQRKAATENT